MYDRYHPPQLCPTCPLRQLGLAKVSDIVPGSRAITMIRLDRGQVLSQGEETDRHSVLRFGTLKIEYLSGEGRPEVAGFLLPGEPIAASFSDQPITVTALSDAVLCSVDPALVLRGSPRAAEIIHEVCRSAAAQAIVDQHRLLCARTGDVAERVLWFLKDLAERQESALIELTMSREDIGHYLATRPESISRALAALERKGAIDRQRTRRIRLLG